MSTSSDRLWAERDWAERRPTRSRSASPAAASLGARLVLSGHELCLVDVVVAPAQQPLVRVEESPQLRLVTALVQLRRERREADRHAFARLLERELVREEVVVDRRLAADARVADADVAARSGGRDELRLQAPLTRAISHACAVRWRAGGTSFAWSGRHARRSVLSEPSGSTCRHVVDASWTCPPRQRLGQSPRASTDVRRKECSSSELKRVRPSSVSCST